MPVGTTRRPPRPMTGPDVTGLARPPPPPGLLRHHAAGHTNRAAGASVPDVRQSSLPDAAPPLVDRHPSRAGAHARRRPPRAGRAPTAGRPGQLCAPRSAMVVMATTTRVAQSFRRAGSSCGQRRGSRRGLDTTAVAARPLHPPGGRVRGARLLHRTREGTSPRPKPAGAETSVREAGPRWPRGHTEVSMNQCQHKRQVS